MPIPGFGCWAAVAATAALAQSPHGPHLPPASRHVVEATSSAAGGLRRSDDLKTVFRGRELSHAVIDGMAVHAGDMVLGGGGDLEPRPPLPASGKSTDQLLLERRELSPHRPEYLWPEGVVPYVIDPDVSAEQRQN